MVRCEKVFKKYFFPFLPPFFALFLALLRLTQLTEVWILHFRKGRSHIIQARSPNYGISSPSLLSMLWRVTVTHFIQLLPNQELKTDCGEHRVFALLIQMSPPSPLRSRTCISSMAFNWADEWAGPGWWLEGKETASLDYGMPPAKYRSLRENTNGP